MARELIVVGDRILIKPEEDPSRTRHGLYLPQGVHEKEAIRSGTVVKTGPGTPVADLQSVAEEPWKPKKTESHFIPVQTRPGDHAIFLRDAAIEIEFEGTKYLIVPQSAILVLVRDDLNEALRSIESSSP